MREIKRAKISHQEGVFETLPLKIISLIKELNGLQKMSFVIKDTNGKEIARKSDELAGEQLVLKTKKGDVVVNIDDEGMVSVSESLITNHSLEQLKKIRKLSKGIDIGDKLKDGSKPILDDDIETIEDYYNSRMVEKFSQFSKSSERSDVLQNRIVEMVSTIKKKRFKKITNEVLAIIENEAWFKEVMINFGISKLKYDTIHMNIYESNYDKKSFFEKIEDKLDDMIFIWENNKVYVFKIEDC